MKTILEINYKIIFEKDKDYLGYLFDTKRTQPDLYEDMLRAEKEKTKVSSTLIIENGVGKRIRTVKSYRLGLA